MAAPPPLPKNVRIELQEKTDTADSFGQLQPAWVTVYTCWAAFAALTISRTLREEMIAQRLTPKVSHVITIQYSRTNLVTPQKRFRYADPVEGERIFNIMGVVDMDESKVDIQCLCWEVKTA